MSPLLTNAEMDTISRYLGLAVARMAMAESAREGGDETMAQEIADTFMAEYLAEQKANSEAHEAQKAAERGEG